MILSILFHNLSLCIQFAIWCVAFFPALFPFLDKALFNRHISIKNHRIIIAWLHSHRKCKRNEMPWVWFELRQHFDTNTNTNIETDIQSLSLKITNQPNMIAATLSYIYLSLLVKIHCGTMCARVLCVCSICGGWIHILILYTIGSRHFANWTIHRYYMYVLHVPQIKMLTAEMCVSFNRRLIGFLWVFILWWHSKCESIHWYDSRQLIGTAWNLLKNTSTNYTE